MNNEKHEQHHKEEENKAMFGCKKCDEKFKELTLLREHEKSHSGKEGEQEELTKIKNEILEEIKSKKVKGKLSWGSTIVTGVLILLVAVSVAQAVQSFNILDKLNSGAVKPTGAQGASDAPLPSSLQDLLDMVGGC